MSHWIEIKDSTDVSLSLVKDEVHVYIGYDDFGNNYVSVPISFIIDALSELGYKVTKPE